MFQEQHLAFSTIFSILAPNKTLFAFASRYGNSSEYNKQMCQVFTEKCASYAKLHPDFEFQVDNISVKDKVQVEKILKEINSYDNLVITSPIHAGKFESSMTKFLGSIAKANPKKLKANAAFGVCGEANGFSPENDKKGNAKLASMTDAERKKFLQEKREKLTNQLVSENLKKLVGQDMTKSFAMQDVLPGQIQYEKFPLYMKLLFRFVLGIKKPAGQLDFNRSKEDISKFFDVIVRKSKKE